MVDIWEEDMVVTVDMVVMEDMVDMVVMEKLWWTYGWLWWWHVWWICYGSHSGSGHHFMVDMVDIVMVMDTFQLHQHVFYIFNVFFFIYIFNVFYLYF